MSTDMANIVNSIQAISKLPPEAAVLKGNNLEAARVNDFETLLQRI